MDKVADACRKVFRYDSSQSVSGRHCSLNEGRVARGFKEMDGEVKSKRMKMPAVFSMRI